MKLLKLFQKRTNKETGVITNDYLGGDGKAEILGAGTYEEYENEREEVKTWRDIVVDRLVGRSK